MANVVKHPALSPFGGFLWAPELGEENELLKAGRQVFLPVRASCSRNVYRVSLQVLYRTAVMGEGPMDIDQLVKCAQFLPEFRSLF